MYDRLDRHFCPPNIYAFPSQAVAAIIATVLCPDPCILELLLIFTFFFKGCQNTLYTKGYYKSEASFLFCGQTLTVLGI